MRHQDTLTTTDLDLMAAIMAATGRTPSVYLQPGASLAVAELHLDETAESAVVDYAAATLVVNARRYAACRAFLYRETRRVCRSGIDRHE